MHLVFGSANVSYEANHCHCESSTILFLSPNFDFIIQIVAVSPGSSRYARSPSYDTGDRDGGRSYSRDGGRSYSRDDSKSETSGMRRRHGTDSEERNQGGVSHSRQERERDEDGRKRSRYEGSRRTPGMFRFHHLGCFRLCISYNMFEIVKMVIRQHLPHKERCKRRKKL